MHRFSRLLTAALFFCAAPAAAQPLLTHAGSGGSATCGGTLLHATAPNDFTNAAWAKQNLTAAASVSDPLGGSNASKVTSNSVAGGIFSTDALNLVAAVSTSISYSLTGFFKVLTGPNWIMFGLFDNVAYTGAAFFDVANGVVGSTRANGGATVQCKKIAAAGNGYFQVSIAATPGSTNSSGPGVYLCDADVTCNPTLNQSVAGFQISP